MNTTTADYGCRLATTVPYQTYGYPHYDGALNLLTRVDSTHGNAKDSATFAVGDRVVSWLGASYTYDADGNRATRTVASTVTTYTWDASGRLLQVKTGTDSVTYAYNALGDLARRSTRGRVDRWFIWEEGQLLEELDSTAQHRVNAFAYLPGTDAPLARITGDAASTIEFVQQDGRGDVIGLTQGASVSQHVLYGPWGNVEGFSGDSLPQTRLGWKGLVWEGGTAQLYYVRSRWYDPQSRSFLSEDPLGLSGGRNTYAYADNDPINGWDPSGLTMAPVITTASCWGFVECGGNPEGGSGWGITDVLNGLSGGGSGGGTGGMHGGGGGGGGGGRAAAPNGASHKSCGLLWTEFAVSAASDVAFIFGVGAVAKGAAAAWRLVPAVAEKAAAFAAYAEATSALELSKEYSATASELAIYSPWRQASRPLPFLAATTTLGMATRSADADYNIITRQSIGDSLKDIAPIWGSIRAFKRARACSKEQ